MLLLCRSTVPCKRALAEVVLEQLLPPVRCDLRRRILVALDHRLFVDRMQRAQERRFPLIEILALVLIVLVLSDCKQLLLVVVFFRLNDLAISAILLFRKLLLLLMLRLLTELLVAWSYLISAVLVGLAIWLFTACNDRLFYDFLLILVDHELVVSVLVVSARGLLHPRARILPDVNGA